MTHHSELTQARKDSALRTALHTIVPYLDDDKIIEIMVNPDGKVWVEILGNGMEFTGVILPFEETENIIRLLASTMGSVITEQNPSVSAKLPGWGARVQAMIPPVVAGPSFCFRKPAKYVFPLDRYIEQKVLTREQANFLRWAVAEKKNILVGGGTGSGKTTFVNALLQEIAATKDRVYIVEDNPELQCDAENKVEVLVNTKHYNHSSAIVDSLRYRPDRIIVGEVRDGSALDLLKSWNTGHPGGIATIHANNTHSMLDRLCQLCEEVVLTAPRYLIAEAINVVIHIQRDSGHAAGRSISGIELVTGVNSSGEWIFQKPDFSQYR
jgi:type IV secretion system protein VirB11